MRKGRDRLPATIKSLEGLCTKPPRFTGQKDIKSELNTPPPLVFFLFCFLLQWTIL